MRRILKRAFTSTASSTLVRMAKKTSELTIQVLPKSSANGDQALTSSSAKATPRKNMCQSKRRSVRRAALIRRSSSPPARSGCHHGQARDVDRRESFARPGR